MTSHKHLKARVRARMSKTGERYAEARRHVVAAAGQPATRDLGYPLRGGVHPDAAAVVHSLLATPADGGSISEAMVLGIGGGLGAGYILWEFESRGEPIVTLGFSNQWQYPDRWLRKTCGRIGVGVDLRETGGASKAMADLVTVLDAGGPPPLVWIDACEIGYWHLPTSLSGMGGYPVVVYRQSGDRFHIDDRNTAPLTVDAATLRAARGRVPSYANRMVVLQPPDTIPEGVLATAVREGLADQVEHLASTSQSFSLPAWRKWSRLLVDERNAKAWPVVFRDQHGLFGALLTVYESIGSTGFGGGSLRALYAAFLEEAGALLDDPALTGEAARAHDLDRMWRDLAAAAVPESVAAFRDAKDLIDQLHEHVLDDGDAGRPAAEAVAAALWAERTRLKDVELFDPLALQELLGSLSAQLAAIFGEEQALISALRAHAG